MSFGYPSMSVCSHSISTTCIRRERFSIVFTDLLIGVLLMDPSRNTSVEAIRRSYLLRKFFSILIFGFVGNDIGCIFLYKSLIAIYLTKDLTSAFIGFRG